MPSWGQPSRHRSLQGKTDKSAWPRQRATSTMTFPMPDWKNSRARPRRKQRRPRRKAACRGPRPQRLWQQLWRGFWFVMVRQAPLAGDATAALAKPDRSKAVAPARGAEDDFVAVL